MKGKCAKCQRQFFPISFLRVSYPSSFPPISIIPITEVEIRSVIKPLKCKVSSGYIKISSKIMWDTNLCPPSVINQFLFVIVLNISNMLMWNPCTRKLVTPLLLIIDLCSFGNIFKNNWDSNSVSQIKSSSISWYILVAEQYGFRKGLSS